MKKISSAKFCNISTIHLTYSDLVEIVKIIQNNCSSVSIVSDEVQYDSLAELQSEKQNSNLSGLSITGHRPYVSIDFEKK